MHKLNGIIAGITIRGLTSPARLEPGEPRDVSLRILFAQSIVMPQNLPMGAYVVGNMSWRDHWLSTGEGARRFGAAPGIRGQPPVEFDSRGPAHAQWHSI